MTVSASAAKDEKAEYGDVLVPGKSILTSWAMRGGKDNGTIIGGQSEDDDIEKTTDNRPKEQGKQESQRSRVPLC